MRASNPLEEKIIALLEPAAADVGYALVRVRLSGLKRKRLQIMAERLSDGTMNIDDCSKLSRAISPVLEAEDPIKGFYDLEVSSPGIDRPLVRLEDFTRFVGHEAKIELGQGVDGRRRYRGIIAGVGGDQVTMTVDGEDATFPFAWVSEARLMLTDQLIEEDLRRAKTAEATDAALKNADPADPSVLPREGKAARRASGVTDGAAAPTSDTASPPPQSALRADSSPSRGSTGNRVHANKSTKRKPT